MASPFAVFRRNQRVMIAVLGVLTILLFVVGDSVSRIIGSTRNPENPVVVKTNYGNYRRSELASLNYQRQMVKIFLQRVVSARVQKAVEDKQLPAERAQQAADQFYLSLQQQLMGRMHPSGDAATIETLVLAKRAEELGMVASDGTVNDYLKMVADDVFPQIRSIIASLKPDGRSSVGEGRLFDALRRELLASKFAEMFRLGTMGMPPAERWGYFSELNLKADAQVLAVKAEQFLKDVPEPSPEKLQSFFERYQNRFPDPNSPEPGFKEPLKIAFQYFKANIDEFTERAAAEVTDEEVQAYYEKNKATHYRALELPPEKSPDAKSDAAPGNDAGSDGDAGTSGDAEGSQSAPAASDGTPAATPKSDAADEQQETPAGGKPAAAPKAGGKSSRMEPAGGAHSFRLASAPGQKSADAKSADAATEPAAGEQPAAETPSADSAAGSDGANGDGADGDQKADHADADHDHAGHEHGKAEEPKYEPLEKVADQVRKEVAREKGQQAVSDAFDRLRSKMREYGSSYSAYLANREENPGLEPPEKLDAAALAKEYGVTAHETEPISAYEAQTQTEIGKSSNFTNDPRLGFRQVSFAQMAFTDPHRFRPEVTFDDESNRFLWWETSIVPETVPSLEEKRGEVLHAFKMREAHELALKKAEAYAAEARAAKRSLREVFQGRAGLEVVETGPFTRMTMGVVPFDPQSSEPRLSPIHGVEAPGADFMNAVFGSAAEEVSVALNEPRQVAYVIQVMNFSPPRDLLEHEFILEPFQKYARLASDAERALYLSWINSLQTRANVDWIEPPRGDAHDED